MMPDRLKTRQQKIQEKRKQTSWRDFLMEIASWYTFSFYRNGNTISNFPSGERMGGVLTVSENLENNMFDHVDGDSPFAVLGMLLKNNKLPCVSHYGDIENCDYATTVNNSKNIYLSSNLTGCENTAYSYSIKYSSDIYNSVLVWDGASCVYESIAVFRSHEVFYSCNVTDSQQIRFSKDLVGCRECLYCEGLEHHSFCIENIQYSEKEYYEKKKNILSNKNSFSRNGSIMMDGYAPFTEDVQNGFASSYLKEGRNVCFGGNPKGAERYYDCFSVGRGEDMYGGVNSGGSFAHAYCCYNVGKTMNTFYCIHLQACSYCFGCIGLKNKSYCIFNKQYTKEERYNKVDEIFTQMEQDDTLGQFFPGSMNPFYFNDTAAYLIDDSFIKEEVTAKGYLWRDEPIQVDIPAGATVIKTTELDQYEGRKDSSTSSEGQEWWIDPEILKVIIQDEQGNVYRIVQMEYDFLLKHGLPLPRKHRLDRMKENFRVS